MLLMLMLWEEERPRRVRRQTLRSGASAASNSRQSRSRPAASRACNLSLEVFEVGLREARPRRGEPVPSLRILPFQVVLTANTNCSNLHPLAPPRTLYTSSSLTGDAADPSQRRPFACPSARSEEEFSLQPEFTPIASSPGSCPPRVCGRGPVAFEVRVGPSRQAIELESRAAPSCLQRPPHSLPTLFALKTLLNSETSVRSAVRGMSATVSWISTSESKR